MPAQHARFPAPAAVGPWGWAKGEAAWSSSAPRASSLVRWDQKAEGNPNNQKVGEEKREAEGKHIIDKYCIYGTVLL